MKVGYDLLVAIYVPRNHDHRNIYGYIHGEQLELVVGFAKGKVGLVKVGCSNALQVAGVKYIATSEVNVG